MVKKIDPEIRRLSPAEKKKLLQTEVALLNKKFGKEVVSFGYDKEIERISFNNSALDSITGGGVAVGRFNILWGAKGSAKTTLCYNLVASAQKMGKLCMWIDMEKSLDTTWAATQGVNIKELLIAPSFSTAEETLDSIIDLTKKKLIDLIIVDSIHGLSPKGEQETKKGIKKSIEDDTMALLARRLSKFFRISATGIAESKCTIVLIGQTRMDLGGFITLEKLSGGNCFPIDTRILTNNGLKYYNETKTGDLIPTINLSKRSIEYKPIKKIFLYNFNGKLNYFKNKYSKSFAFTNEHQCLVKTFKWDKLKSNSSLKGKNYKLINASDYRRTYAFPVCFPSGNKDYKITDNELKLIGWLVTDGTIQIADKKANDWKKYQTRVCIYQTKYKQVIEKLLNSLKIKYALRKRIRKDKRDAFKNTKESWTFYLLNPKDIIKKYRLTSDKAIPNWIFKISDRQARVLFDAIILGDGTRKKSGYPSAIYDGNKTNLEKLAHLFVTHNIPISKIIKQPNKKCWVIQLTQCDYIGFSPHHKQVFKKKYSGKIWDISVDNNLHFIERNGQIIATHNSLEHWSSLTVHLRRGKKTDAPKKSGELIGFNMVARVDKSKVGPDEGKICKIDFMYGKGVNDKIC